VSIFSALTLFVGCQEKHLTCKMEWWGAGMVISLERGADNLSIVQLLPLVSLKSWIVLPFCCGPIHVNLKKRLLNGCLCMLMNYCTHFSIKCDFVIVIFEQTFKYSSKATETKTVGNIQSRFTSKTVWRHHTGVCRGMLTMYLITSFCGSSHFNKLTTTFL